MPTVFHLLNGDALKEQFPNNIAGNKIVWRECLMDGPVGGKSIEEIISKRRRYFEDVLNISATEYDEKTNSELDKIKNIPIGSDIHLWFEDDLFCQINFWFLTKYLYEDLQHQNLFLVRPLSHSPYSFGHLSETELITAYQNKVFLSQFSDLASLWSAYQNNNSGKLETISKSLNGSFPFILPAARAHIERIPTDDKRGRPIESLDLIIKELQTDDFGTIFKEFCKRESIYGYGDLQVKHMYNELRTSK